MNTDQVKELIIKGIPGSTVEVADTKKSGDHFSAIVISDLFEGLSLIEQHQMVYKSLGKLLTNEVHALQLKTYTVSKWEKENK